jgi:hypothetical protein
MRTSPLIALAATAALATPALVLADGIGPHSSWYDQHPKTTKPVNDVSIVVHRDKGDADVFVSNFCLGTEAGGPSGTTQYPNSAAARGVRVSHNKISYSGKATIFTRNGQRQVALNFTAAIKPKKATGSAKFPNESACKPIPFKAKLAKRTK